MTASAEIWAIKMTELFSAEHLDAVEALEKECFSTPWSRKSLEEILNNPLADYLVFLKDRKVVGYVGMLSVEDEGYINNIAVKGDFRRQGIGYALMSDLICTARQKKLSFIALEVRHSNTAAINLYTSLGFVTEGVRRGYYTQPKEDACLMKLFLSERKTT